MTTATVCKACGDVMGHVVTGTGTPNCGNIFCEDSPDHNIPVVITIPDIAHCSVCQQVATYRDGSWSIGNEQPSGNGSIKNAWMTELPFYVVKDQTYYCGCRGWE
jgi:hypothetical protein